MPVIKTHRAMHRIASGEALHVITDDKTSLQDIPLWCQKAGHILLETHEAPDGCHFVIQRHALSNQAASSDQERDHLP